MDTIQSPVLPEVTMPPKNTDSFDKHWNFGLGNLASWANVGACVVMFFLFYQAQSNAFIIYQQDRAQHHEDMKTLWDVQRTVQTQHDKDMARLTEAQQTQSEVLREMQRINAEMLQQLKLLSERIK